MSDAPEGGYVNLEEAAELEDVGPASPASVPLDPRSDGSTCSGGESSSDEDGWEPLRESAGDEEGAARPPPAPAPSLTQGALRVGGGAAAVAAVAASLPPPTHHVLGAPPPGEADDFPLPQGHKDAILAAMANFSLQYRPAWSGAVAEEAWRADVRRRLRGPGGGS